MAQVGEIDLLCRCYARAAIAVGVASLFIETHDDPDKAPSDGPNMLRLDDMEQVLSQLKKIDEVTKANLYGKS